MMVANSLNQIHNDWSTDFQDLVTWATPQLSEDKVKQCVDARLLGDYPSKALAKFATAATFCLQYEAHFREHCSQSSPAFFAR
ncbi:hypothetical protein SLE2022_052250 [Rubroshorea leprosula]